MKTPEKDIFFIGFLSKWPAGLKWFLPAVAGALIGLFVTMALGIGATQRDPGTGGLAGRQQVTGIVEIEPYPMLHIVEGTDRLPAGQTVMLANLNKQGVQHRDHIADGAYLTITGPLARRGTLDVLQAGFGRRAIVPADNGETVLAPPPEALGTWRLTGEICDGKCYAGAMRPGNGLAHKACANMCLVGGVPPVFVSTGPVEGEIFFLMGAPDGGPIDASLLDWTASPVVLEGTIERRGTLMIFRPDPASVRPAE